MMKILTRYYPYEYVEDVFSIDYPFLQQQGIKGVIFDIDNTLVAHGADSTEKVDELFRCLHQLGLQTLLLSNNSEERIRRFMAHIDTFFIADANKPEKSGYFAALKMMHLDKHEVVVVGDQVFSDILGANESGLASILVKYIGYYKKEKKGIKRTLEKLILFCYAHQPKYLHRLGNVTK